MVLHRELDICDILLCLLIIIIIKNIIMKWFLSCPLAIPFFPLQNGGHHSSGPRIPCWGPVRPVRLISGPVSPVRLWGGEACERHILLTAGAPLCPYRRKQARHAGCQRDGWNKTSLSSRGPQYCTAGPPPSALPSPPALSLSLRIKPTLSANERAASSLAAIIGIIQE